MNIENPLELTEYLAGRGYSCGGQRSQFRVLAGGVSSATVQIRLDDGQVWVLKKALPKLRTRVDWFSPVTRVHREAAGMKVLAGMLPAGCVPELIFDDHIHHIIAMTAVREPHENFKDVLMAGRVDDDAIRQFASILATIHRYGEEYSQQLSIDFADRSFFESLRLEPYYAYAARQIPEAAEFLDSLIDDTLQRRMTLVHGDYSPKNVLIHAGKLVLLDHEVVHFGDPAFDIGFAITHLLSKAHHLAHRRPLFRHAAILFWETYLTLLGDQAIKSFETLPNYESRCVKHVLGCLLARAAGRSRLEYLSEAEQNRQAQAVIQLIADRPVGVKQLIDAFLYRI